MLDVGRVDQNQSVGQAVRCVRIELGQMGEGADHVALAVQETERALALLEFLQVPVDQPLQQLGLAVAGAAQDVGVLEPGRE